MCRFLLILSKTYINTNDLNKYFWLLNNSIFKQCYNKSYTPFDENNPRNHKINIDGYGIGFYNNNRPIIYKSIFPPWNDTNFFHMIPVIKTKLMMAHIRAANCLIEDTLNHIYEKKYSPVYNYNCHPFSYENYLFLHNGCIDVFYKGKERKKIINKIDDDLLLNILGNTDSEYIFYLLMTFIKKYNNVLKSIKKTIKFLNNFEGIFSFNIILTHKKKIWVTRYINNLLPDKQPPSLYYLNNEDKLIVSSEPLDTSDNNWIYIEKNSIIEYKKNILKINKLETS